MDSGRYTPPDQPVETPGSLDSESRLVEAYRERLRLFAARRLRDWSAAEDVAQEALARALEAMRAGRIEDPAALPGFLFQTALHVCLRRIRSAGRERRALQRFSGGGEGDGGQSPLAALLSAERRSRVLQALERVEPDDRRLLELTFRDELDSEEIGRRLGLTPGAVRVRRHRAIRRLAETLGVTKPGDRELKE